MERSMAKEQALKDVKAGDTVTDEFDPFRGFWVRSEEGDIIHPGGERGYWKSEPPTPEFRAERRKKLAKSR